MLNGLNTKPYGKYNSPAFGNGALLAINTGLTRGFQFLQNNPVVELAGLDIGTMAGPRTYCDAKQNPIYGLETGIRETVAMIPNPFLPGIIAGAMIAKEGYKGLYADSTTLNSIHEAWKVAGGEKFDPTKPDKKIVGKYVNTILKNTTGLVGEDNVKLSEKDFKIISTKLTNAIMKGYKKGDKKSQAKFLKVINNIAGKYTEATGASESITVDKIGKAAEKLDTSIRRLFRDKAEAATQIFTKNNGEQAREIIKELKDFSVKKTKYAIIPSIALGASMQSIINGVSKAITGKDGFTGYKSFDKKDCEENKDNKNLDSSNLVMKKALAITGILGMSFATMGGFTKHNVLKPKGWANLAKSLEMNDRFAHLQVIKLVYGGIIAGRLAKAREETELKTTTYRDYSGFLNWLVLGPFAAKGVASAIKASTKLNLLNGTIKGNTRFEKAKSWLFDVSLKAPDEMMAMLKKMPKGKAGAQAWYNVTKTAGLAWSTFALGFGMPLVLNKYVIDKADKHTCKDNACNTNAPQGNTLLSFMQNSRPSVLKKYDKLMA